MGNTSTDDRRETSVTAPLVEQEFLGLDAGESLQESCAQEELECHLEVTRHRSLGNQASLAPVSKQ